MKKEKQLGAFSQAVKDRKEKLYDKVKLNVRQLDIIIWIAGIALAIVILLMILEATGIFKL